MEREKEPGKVLSEIFSPVKVEEKISSVSKWSDNRSEKSRLSKTAVSSVSKWYVGSTTVWMVVGCILDYWVFVPTAFFSGLVAWPGSFNEYNIEGVCVRARQVDSL